MSHTLMRLDAEWRRLARTSRARRALKQWSIAHPALRGVADLDALLERRRDDQAAPAILRALAVPAPGDDLARTQLQALLPGLVRLADRPVPEATCGTQELGGIESPLFIERGPAGPRNANKRSSSQPAHFWPAPVWMC
jgi:hypothetical protein